MDYQNLTQNINDINYLRQENNIFSIIEIIKHIGQLQGSPKREECVFVTKYIQTICKQKDMRRPFYMDSLFEGLKTVQMIIKKGLKMDVKVMIIKMISFAGENSFIEDGLYLSKYFYFLQKKPDITYPEFYRSQQVMGWKLTSFEIDVARNIVEARDKDQNQFVLLNRVKLLQKLIQGFNEQYFDEIMQNLQLAGHLLSEKDMYYKEYLLLSHKMIITQIKQGKKIEMNQISQFYIHNLYQGSLNEDQFGGLLAELLQINRQTQEKKLVHSIIIDCLSQISIKNEKNNTFFYNKNIVTVIEVLCQQLDDPDLIDKVAHCLSEAPPNPKIRHISLLLKISNALKEEKQAIETKKATQKNYNNLQNFTILYNQEDSNISSESTAMNTFHNYKQKLSNTQNSLFNASSSQSTKDNDNKYQKNKKQSHQYQNKTKRLSNAKQQDILENSQKENIQDFSNHENSTTYQSQFNIKMMNEDEDEETQDYEINQENKGQKNSLFQPKKLNKIKEEDQFFRLSEEYQELEVKEIGGIQKQMAYNIFNQIQNLKSIYFNNLLNSKKILEDIEKNKKKKNKDIEQIDQDLLNLLQIQIEICNLFGEEEINRQDLKCQNLFIIFLFFLSNVQEQDNIDYNYKRFRARGGSNLYSTFSVQFKQLVEDILKNHKYPSQDKVDSKQLKSRSQVSSDYKKRLLEQRCNQLTYFIRASLVLSKSQNSIEREISYELLEAIMENINCEDIDQIYTIINSYSYDENIDMYKKLRIIADRSIDLLLEVHTDEFDNQKHGTSRRLSSSIQKEQKIAAKKDKLTKTLECITIINLIYLNTGQSYQLENDQSPIINDLRKKLDEIKEYYFKNQYQQQQLYIQKIMETVCRYLFNKKNKQKYSLQVNINEIFNEIGQIFIQLLKWNENDVIQQLNLLLSYMEFNDFCVTQLLQDMNEGVDSFEVKKKSIDSFRYSDIYNMNEGNNSVQETQKYINLIRKLTIQNFEKFHAHAVESLDFGDEKAFNKVLIQILTKLTQILNNKISQNQNHNFQTIHTKMTLVNKIIYLILENRMIETSSNPNLMSTQLIYEGGSYYNQILLMLQETSEDLHSVIEWNLHARSKNQRNHQYFQVEHTHSFLINVMLTQTQESPLYQRYEFLKQNLSWYDIKQLLHSIRYMKEQSAYFKVGILQANLILIEILLLKFLRYEGEILNGNSLDQIERISVSNDENEIKGEYYQKFIDLRIEENIEQYIKALHQNKEYEESGKIFVYSQSNSQVESIQHWLNEVKRVTNGNRSKQSKILQKYRAQLKCLIHELSVLRIENNTLLSIYVQQDISYNSIQFKKAHLRDIMKVADKIENKIEKYQFNQKISSIKQSQISDYLLMSLIMNLNCAKYIRQCNQSHLSTQIIEKAFRRLTFQCFDKAVGQISDIFQNQNQLGGSQRQQASAKATQEYNQHQSLIGYLIDPFSKIDNLLNEQRYSTLNKVTSDLIDYLNIGNGFSYFKAQGSQRIQLLLLQCLRDYCQSQLAQNCFTNIKIYGKLLQTASARFLQLDELLKIQSILKEHSKEHSDNSIFLNVIGNILISEQIGMAGMSSLHNLFSRRKSSVVTMQLSTFIQTLKNKLLTQKPFLQTSYFFKTSLQYMISLFTSTVRPNHKNLESEICEMLSFKQKKISCISSQKNINQIQSDNNQNENKSNSGTCDLYNKILSINTKSNSPYIIVSQDFYTHIISHKNYQSVILRYFSLLQSLNLLSKVTDCRVNISTKAYDTLNVNVTQNNEINGLFIQMINFREISKNLHQQFLSYHIIKSKQFFYLYHKFDETIKELLREMPSLLHIYKDYVIIKNCECVCLNETKASLIQSNEDGFILESFSLDTSYIYKSMIIKNKEYSQGTQQDQSLDSDKKKFKSNKMEDEQVNYSSKLKPSKTNKQQNIVLTESDFEFKKLRTSMRDFSISKYTKSKLTQYLEKSFKNSRLNMFAYRKHSLQQLNLEHDLMILNFIDYNNERAIQISKFNHLTKKYSSFKINSQSQTTLFADYLSDMKKILQKNETEMRDDEKKRKSIIDHNNWWKIRTSYDNQLEKILSLTQQIFDYHIFLFFGSENKEKEIQIINFLSEQLNVCEKMRFPEADSDNQSDLQILVEEKDNLIEILFSSIKCSLFKSLNDLEYKLVFELICAQNIYLQNLRMQAQQYLFSQIIKFKKELYKNYKQQTRKPSLWILSENISQVPLEFMSIFPSNSQTFYRIPSIKYLCENYVSENKVNFADNYYLLNPSEDLIHTQKTFQSKFESIRTWEGASGFAVKSYELQNVLKKHECYTYIGHGAGEIYLSFKQIQEIGKIKSAVLLFGCQSARQVEQLDNNSNLYEVTGNSLYLLMTRCKMLIGSLWDITDKDTDKMVYRLIQIFEKTTKKKPIDFTQAYLIAREECKLKMLNGSSFVTFGIPTQFYMK